MVQLVLKNSNSCGVLEQTMSTAKETVGYFDGVVSATSYSSEVLQDAVEYKSLEPEVKTEVGEEEELPDPHHEVYTNYNVNFQRQKRFREGPIVPVWRLLEHSQKNGGLIKLAGDASNQNHFSIWNQWTNSVGMAVPDVRLSSEEGAWYFECEVEPYSPEFAVGFLDINTYKPQG
jgi:hypothetical protein